MNSVSGTTYCTSTTDGNGAVTMSYFNALDEMIEQTQPAKGTTTDTYDPAGNLSTTTTAAGTTTYGYDADNQETTASYSDTAAGYSTPNNVFYAYDADGNRTEMIDGTGSTTYSYDDLERVNSVTNGADATTGYGYDLDSNVTTLTYPNSEEVTYTYDGAGRMTSAEDWLGHTTNYTYDADGNETSGALPNGDTSTQTFDHDDQLTAISDAPTSTPSSPFSSFDSPRNADEQVESETDTGVPSPTTETYSYDQVTRLTSDGSNSYGYDAASNPTTLGNQTQSFNSDEEFTSAASAGGSTATTPTISSVSATPSATSATVTWSTDVASSSYVELGAASGDYTLSAGNGTAATSHSVSISGLVCGATYHYVVISAIGAATADSSDDTFSTSSCSSGDGITLVGTTKGDNGSGSTSDISIDLPSGIEADDQIIVSVTTGNGTIPTTPSGWTLVSTQTGSDSWDSQVSVFRKTASGSETTFDADLGGYTGAIVVAAVYRGVSTTTPIDGVIGQSNDDDNITVGPITASVPGETMVLAEAEITAYTDSWTAPSGYTQEMDDEDQNWGSAALADATLPFNGSSGTPTATLSDGSALSVILFGLEPASSTATTPTISSVSATPSATSATVTWSTDVASSSYVELGAASGDYTLSAGNGTAATSHSVSISGLVCGATYHYVVISAIGAATADSSDDTFSTSSCSSGDGITLVGTTKGDNGSGSTSDISIDLPSGIEADDQIIVSVTTGNGTIPTTPSGWTLVSTQTGSDSWDSQVSVFRKTASGSETTFDADLGGYTGAIVVAAVYRGVAPPRRSTGSLASPTTTTTSLSVPSPPASPARPWCWPKLRSPRTPTRGLRRAATPKRWTTRTKTGAPPLWPTPPCRSMASSGTPTATLSDGSAPFGHSLRSRTSFEHQHHLCLRLDR